MKIHYRVKQDTVEIVRCFGSDPHIILPDEIDGKKVTSAAAYTFSGRKGREDKDVFIYESEEHRMFREQEHLLAGELVESVVFPKYMSKIGNYIFYGCRFLNEIEYSDCLTGIGSGAFTGCRSLRKLRVHLERGEKTCVKEILEDLWQRIDVELLRDTGAGETVAARLVFPEHYEEAVENTPARILFTQHHGSGNNYRQCFSDRQIDYRKYDGLFAVAKVYDKPAVLAELAFSRLCYPEGMTSAAEVSYESYIRDNGDSVAEVLIDTENTEALEEMARRKLWDKPTLESAIEYAAEKKAKEILVRLMEEKNRLFPAGRKKYEL